MMARLPVRPALALWLVLTPATLRAAEATKPAAPAAPTTPVAAGAALFRLHCGICHQPYGTGTLMLARRLGWERALIADRTDLTGGYIEYVVRNGIGSMPPQTRVDLTDAELSRAIAFLTRPSSERSPPAPMPPAGGPP